MVSNGSPATGQLAGRVSLLPVMSLWIGDELSPLERLSMTSFVAHGHPYRLYSYTKFDNVPDGVEQLDAREILPEEDIFINDEFRGYSTFANWFRWELLSRYAGWWSDTDMICLKPLNLDGELVAGRQEDINSGYAKDVELAGQYPKLKRDNWGAIYKGPLINNALIKCANPSHPVVKLLRRFCAKPEYYYLHRIRHGYSNYNRMFWGEQFARRLWKNPLRNVRQRMRKKHGSLLGGPWALTDLIVLNKLFAGVKPSHFFYPVPWQAAQTLVDNTYADNSNPFPESYTVHVWNAVLTRRKIAKDKVGTLNPESFLGRLLREYQI